jgi:hypothetical protein
MWGTERETEPALLQAASQTNGNFFALIPACFLFSRTMKESLDTVLIWHCPDFGHVEDDAATNLHVGFLSVV